MSTQEFLTEREAAEFLNMSRRYLAAARCSGNLPGRTAAPPFHKFGKSVRYRRGDLEQWIADNRHES